MKDRARLEHILTAIARIEQIVESLGIEQFMDSDTEYEAVLHHLTVIGEAANHLSKSTKDKSKRTPWREIVSLRNLVVHEYFGIDKSIVKNIIEADLTSFKEDIEQVLLNN